MQPTAQKSSQSPRPPCWRVLTASCSCVDGNTILRVRLDEGQVLDLSLCASLASALGLRHRTPAASRAPVRPSRPSYAERVAAYRAAWHRYISDLHLSQQALAEELGCSQTTLASYFRRFGQEPGAPQLRTNGKL